MTDLFTSFVPSQITKLDFEIKKPTTSFRPKSWIFSGLLLAINEMCSEIDKKDQLKFQICQQEWKTNLPNSEMIFTVRAWLPGPGQSATAAVLQNFFCLCHMKFLTPHIKHPKSLKAGLIANFHNLSVSNSN